MPGVAQRFLSLPAIALHGQALGICGIASFGSSNGKDESERTSDEIGSKTGTSM